MRTQQDKDIITSNISDPWIIENFLSKNDIDLLIKFFYTSPDKIQKSTGPLTLDITQTELSHEPFKSVIDKLHTILGEFDVFTMLYFYVERPHIVHNDDSFDYPVCFKGINIPLDFNGTEYPKFVFFDQYYLEGPAKFFNKSVDIPGWYNAHVYEYSQVQNLSNQTFSEEQRLMYMSHVKSEWLEGLSMHSVVDSIPGNITVFDTVRLHCAGNFLDQGTSSKLSLSIFTSLKG